MKGGHLSPDRPRPSAYLLAGAVAFAAAQALLFLLARPPGRPTIDSEGWFLNSSTGIAVMATVLAAVAGLAGRVLPGPELWRPWMLFAGGAMAALIGAVFLFGPGTIFPIVIAAGAAVIAVAVLAGAVMARWLFSRGAP